MIGSLGNPPQQWDGLDPKNYFTEHLRAQNAQRNLWVLAAFQHLVHLPHLKQLLKLSISEMTWLQGTRELLSQKSKEQTKQEMLAKMEQARLLAEEESLTSA